MISPTENPIASAIRKEKCVGRFFEWQTDALASAANNAQIEGDDVTSFTAVSPTTRWGNYTQISTKNFIISDTEEKVDKAGRSSEIAKQKLKKTKEILNDREVALSQNTTFNAGALGTARQTRGLAGWITQGSVGATTGAFPVPSSNTAPVAGTARAFSEAILKDMQQKAWTAGGNPTVAYLRALDKQLASSFTGNASRREDADSGKLHAAYSVYVGDFGEIKLVPSRFLDAAVYLVDLEHVGMKTLRPLESKPLAKTGDAEKVLLTMEWGVCMYNKDAHAQARDLT